ncbi:MAG TPA: Sjogren's syndrome/scleroderma autoantigen 1 family protein [Candidatus Limnocylindrales bacterium]|nr:Sjogren's syndrome/scleroderma autoantigen 1 family protein [Candidatus Limnocylindrales bacterium]
MQEKKENDTPIRRMADLLRQGAALTDLSCPVCSSPLFRLKDGTLWCAKDEKKVIIVKEGEELSKSSASTAFDKLESILLSKIQDLQGKIEKTEDPQELQRLSIALSQLLDNLDKIQKMKKPK